VKIICRNAGGMEGHGNKHGEWDQWTLLGVMSQVNKPTPSQIYWFN